MIIVIALGKLNVLVMLYKYVIMFERIFRKKITRQNEFSHELCLEKPITKRKKHSQLIKKQGI